MDRELVKHIPIVECLDIIHDYLPFDECVQIGRYPTSLCRPYHERKDMYEQYESYFHELCSWKSFAHRKRNMKKMNTTHLNKLFLYYVSKCNVTFVKILLQKSEVDIHYSNGRAIHIACKAGNFYIVKLLIESGAKLTDKCIEYILLKKHFDLYWLLKPQITISDKLFASFCKLLIDHTVYKNYIEIIRSLLLNKQITGKIDTYHSPLIELTLKPDRSMEMINYAFFCEVFTIVKEFQSKTDIDYILHELCLLGARKAFDYLLDTHKLTFTDEHRKQEVIKVVKLKMVSTGYYFFYEPILRRLSTTLNDECK